MKSDLSRQKKKQRAKLDSGKNASGNFEMQIMKSNKGKIKSLRYFILPLPIFIFCLQRLPPAFLPDSVFLFMN